MTVKDIVMRMAEAERLRDIFERMSQLNNEELSLADYDVPDAHFAHAVEELGEVARCLRGKNEEPLLNECVDAAICVLAIALIDSEGDIDPIIDVFESKLDKWNSNLVEYRK